MARVLPVMNSSDSWIQMVSDKCSLFLIIHPPMVRLSVRYARSKRHLKKLRTEVKATHKTQVHRFLFSFRTASRTATVVSSLELMFKRQLRTAFHLLKSDTYHRIEGYEANMAQWTKVMRSLCQFKVDDHIPGAEFRSWGTVNGGHHYQTTGVWKLWNGSGWRLGEAKCGSTSKTAPPPKDRCESRCPMCQW